MLRLLPNAGCTVGPFIRMPSVPASFILPTLSGLLLFSLAKATASNPGIPAMYTFHTEYTPQKGLRWHVLFYPTPHVEITYNYEYRRLANELVNDADIPWCPGDLSTVLRAFCLTEVETFDEEGTRKTWTDKLYGTNRTPGLLSVALANENKRRPDSVGNMNDAGTEGILMNGPTVHPLYGNTMNVNGIEFRV